MSALQNFFDAERLRRGWSMRETAKRSQISLSKAYAIVNGDDNVEFETFEAIAYAFDMTPAELATAIGKGPAHEHPQRVALQALLRQVPDDELGTVERVVRPFATAIRHANARLIRSAKHASKNVSASSDEGDPPFDNSQMVWYDRLVPTLASGVA